MPPDNPNCLYHPHLAKFEEIWGVNTESCEQGFFRLNQYLELTRKMTQFKRNVLFWFVNECFNSDLEAELKRKQLLLFQRLFILGYFYELEIRLPQNLAKVIWLYMVCLKFQGWCSKSGPKSNTHCASYIADELTADHILTSWKMAASSVLTVNYRGEALFVKNRAYDRMENLYSCVNKIVNISYQFFSKEKNVKNLCASLRYES